MATDSDKAVRWWLLLSNVFYLASAGYLIYMCIKKKTYHRLIHALVAVAIAVASFLFHYCDTQDVPGDGGYLHFCPLPWDRVYNIDFTLSAVGVLNVFTYRLPIHHMWLRDVTIFVMIFVLWYLDNGSTPLYVAIAVVTAFVLAWRAVFRYYRRGAVHWRWPLLDNPSSTASATLWLVRPDEATDTTTTASAEKRPAVHIIWWLPIEGSYRLPCCSETARASIWLGVSAIVFAVAGIIFYALEGYSYWNLHPIWHLCTAIAMLMGFVWFDVLGGNARSTYTRLNTQDTSSPPRLWIRTTDGGSARSPNTLVQTSVKHPSYANQPDGADDAV